MRASGFPQQGIIRLAEGRSFCGGARHQQCPAEAWRCAASWPPSEGLERFQVGPAIPFGSLDIWRSKRPLRFAGSFLCHSDSVPTFGAARDRSASSYPHTGELFFNQISGGMSVGVRTRTSDMANFRLAPKAAEALRALAGSAAH